MKTVRNNILKVLISLMFLSTIVAMDYSPSPQVLLVLSRPVDKFDWYAIVHAATTDWRVAEDDDYIEKLSSSTILILEREKDWCVVFFHEGGGRVRNEAGCSFYGSDEDILWLGDPNQTIYLRKSDLKRIPRPEDGVIVYPALSTLLPSASIFFEKVEKVKDASRNSTEEPSADNVEIPSQ